MKSATLVLPDPALAPPGPSLLLAQVEEALSASAQRAANPRFAAEKELLTRIAALQRSEEISLNLKDRINLAKTEKSLSDLEKDAESPAEEKEKDKDKKKESDLILQESLQILGDMIDLRKTQEKHNGYSFLENARRW